MKLTAFDKLYSDRVVTGATTLGAASGSNSGGGDYTTGGDVTGPIGNQSVVRLRSQVALASNQLPVNIGDVLTIIQAGVTPLARFATPSNTGIDVSLNTVAASGATETLDVSVARTHDVTLTADCTFTFTGAITAQAWFFTLVLRQDGTGGWTATWPGSVVWSDGAPTLDETAGSVSVLTFFTLDGGTTWYGFLAGDGGGGAPSGAAGGDLSGTYPNPSVVDDSHNHTAATLPSSAATGEILISDTPAGSPLVFSDLIQNEAQDDLVYAD